MTQEEIKKLIDIEYARMLNAYHAKERKQCAERLAKLHKQLEVSDERQK